MENVSFFFVSSKEIALFQPELLLALVWVLALIGLLFPSKKARFFIQALTFVSLIVNIALLLRTIPQKETFFWKDFFYVSWFTQSLKALICFFALISSIVQLSYKKTISEWFVVLLAALLSAFVLVSSATVVGLFLSLEMLSICGYLLVTFHTNQDKTFPFSAGLNYLLFGAAASACLIYGFSWLYGLTHSLYLKDIFSVSLDAKEDALIFYGGLVLLLGGFLFKLAIIPFHFWISEVYFRSSSATVLFLATVPKIAISGVIVFILGQFEHLDTPVREHLEQTLALIASLSVIGGALLAATQTHIKRLFAYSGVSQMGFLLILLISPTDFSKQAVLIFWLFYGLANVIVWKFSANIAIQTQDFKLTGIRLNSVHSALLSSGALSLAGLPPFGGFIVKLLVFYSAWKHYQDWQNTSAVIVLVSISIATLIGFYYYLKVPYFLFLKNRNQPINIHLSKPSQILLMLLVFLNIALVLVGLKIFQL